MYPIFYGLLRREPGGKNNTCRNFATGEWGPAFGCLALLSVLTEPDAGSDPVRHEDPRPKKVGDGHGLPASKGGWIFGKAADRRGSFVVWAKSAAHDKTRSAGFVLGGKGMRASLSPENRAAKLSLACFAHRRDRDGDGRGACRGKALAAQTSPA